ncbi:MAG: AAA family ATPase [Thermodesulfobacteriota bacterium]|nr:AAA family ATPase [Thermodesulfobacteriota bacterium]
MVPTKQKKLPIGIQTFSEIIEEHHAYVDKTGMAVDLVENDLLCLHGAGNS